MRPAAELGHTLSAYSVAMLHYMAVGTYESCLIAQKYLKHVVEVGPEFKKL